MSQIGVSVNDIHSDLRCIILRLRGANCELSELDKDRIEQIIWRTIGDIGGDTMSRERFEQLYMAGVRGKQSVVKYKQKKRAG
ncbi:hypothetical protein [Sporomusa malonica]|uniref:Uncharacterized protein n=1 Tax=Sporomusa malonica TaxID=112901 RepID=A0A1W2AU88_9FIRM|nr:hypothetical protein [Sporomusa malonica]SMC64070.1 hypothetical protein SAMN04488500_106111 [Sporomusa malonica]